MGADEEYLDSLLKSVTADLAGEEKNTESETISEEESFSVEDLFGEKESFFVENDEGETEEISIDDLVFGDEAPEEELADGDTPLDIDAMLKELNLLEEEVSEPEAEPVEEEDSFAEPFYSNDLDEELDEISTLLEKADNNEAIDEDMLTMFAAADTAQVEEEEPFDLMGAINSQESAPVVVDKKAEKERKRKEKEEEKAAKKAAKLAAKEQKKAGKTKEEKETKAVKEVDVAVSLEADESLNQPETTSDEVESTFDTFQEVEGFDDIEALLGSLNMEDLEFAAAPIENKSGLSMSDPEEISSVNELQFEEAPEEGPGTQQESKEDKKKVGWFKRFVDFLMEDDEDEEVDKKKKKTAKSTESKAEETDPNELDKNGKRTVKGKKAKNNNKKDNDGDEDETNDKNGKKKSKKPKKEKQPKSDIEKRFKVVDDGSKKVGKGGIMAILLLAASVFAVVMLSNVIFSPMLAKQRAEKAFKEQNYETCYQELSGWDLSENEAEMRDYARVVLKLERRLNAYEQYKGLRQKLEALDSLMKAVQNYEEIYQEALNCGAESEVEARYVTILGLLDEEYGLSRKEAEAIAALESDVEYTRYLTAVIEGRNIPGLDDGEAEELPGLLPEEEELPDTKFSE